MRLKKLIKLYVSIILLIILPKSYETYISKSLNAIIQIIDMTPNLDKVKQIEGNLKAIQPKHLANLTIK